MLETAKPLFPVFQTQTPMQPWSIVHPCSSAWPEQPCHSWSFTSSCSLPAEATTAKPDFIPVLLELTAQHDRCSMPNPPPWHVAVCSLPALPLLSSASPGPSSSTSTTRPNGSSFILCLPWFPLAFSLQAHPLQLSESAHQSHASPVIQHAVSQPRSKDAFDCGLQTG